MATTESSKPFLSFSGRHDHHETTTGSITEMVNMDTPPSHAISDIASPGIPYLETSSTPPHPSFLHDISGPLKPFHINEGSKTTITPSNPLKSVSTHSLNNENAMIQLASSSTMVEPLAFINANIRNMYRDPMNSDQLAFKCRSGLERCDFVVSSDGIEIRPRVSLGCSLSPKKENSSMKNSSKESSSSSMRTSISSSGSVDHQLINIDGTRPRVCRQSKRVNYSASHRWIEKTKGGVAKIQTNLGLRSNNDLMGNRYQSKERAPIRWDVICGITTKRRSHFESWLGLEVTTGSVIRFCVSNSILDALVDSLKAFYRYNSLGFLKHAHESIRHPMKFNPNCESLHVSIGNRENRSKGLFEKCKWSKNEGRESLKSISESMLPFPLKSGVFETAIDVVHSPPSTPSLTSYCPSCRGRRSNTSVDNRVGSVTKFSLPAGLMEAKEAHATKPLQWVTQPAVKEVFPIPFDVLVRLFCLNDSLPLKLDTTLPGDQGPLLSFLFMTENPDYKKSWGPVEHNSFDGQLPFGVNADIIGALTERSRPISFVPGKPFNPPTTKAFKMTSVHPFPNNMILNRILSLVPALPYESDGYEVFKLVHLSSTLMVIDWIEYIISHRDTQGITIDTGLPSYVFHGGMQPTFRMIFERTKAQRNQNGICECGTAFGTCLGFRFNDASTFTRDTGQSVPDTFSYNDSVQSGPLRMVENIVGKQEASAATTGFITMIRDQCQHLNDASENERNIFMMALAVTHDGISGDRSESNEDVGNHGQGGQVAFRDYASDDVQSSTSMSRDDLKIVIGQTRLGPISVLYFVIFCLLVAFGMLFM